MVSHPPHGTVWQALLSCGDCGSLCCVNEHKQQLSGSNPSLQWKARVLVKEQTGYTFGGGSVVFNRPLRDEKEQIKSSRATPETIIGIKVTTD